MSLISIINHLSSVISCLVSIPRYLMRIDAGIIAFLIGFSSFITSSLVGAVS